MSFTKRQGWAFGCCLVVLGLAASPQAFADPPAKAPIAGLIDMQQITFHNTNRGQPKFTMHNVEKYAGVFGGIVFNGTWDEMQPSPTGPLVTTRLDDALDQVRQYNLDHPTAPLAVKLRIFSGDKAPEWAKEIGGRPLRIQRNPMGCPSGDCPITIGRVWEQPYIAAWRKFQRAVATQYDSEPLIRSVAITSCTMETDEPFVMPVGQPVPKGYTDAAGRLCLRHAVQDYVAWTTTPIDYTINAFDQIEQGGSDPRFSFAVMKACRDALGSRCELGNHAFAATMPPGNTEIVDRISRLGGPIHYQTVGPKTDGFDWFDTVRAARRKNATGLELWPVKQFGGFDSLSRREVRRLGAIFNAPR